MKIPYDIIILGRGYKNISTRTGIYRTYSLIKHLEKSSFDNIKIQTPGNANAALTQMPIFYFGIKSFRGKKIL